MLNKITLLLISLFLLTSCSTSNYKIGEKVNYNNFFITNEELLFNSVQFIPLWQDKKNDNIKIAVDNDLICYIQNSSEEEIQKFSKQLGEISIDNIFVEPGVCYYIELGNNKYGYLGRIDKEIDVTNLSISYIYEKNISVLIGNINRPLTYKEYVNWISDSIIIDDVSYEKKYIFN